MLRSAVDREVKQGIGRRIPKDPLKIHFQRNKPRDEGFRIK